MSRTSAGASVGSTRVGNVESEWPVWVLEAATHFEDLGVLDRLDERLRAAGFTPADLRYEDDRVGVFIGVRVAKHDDVLNALFRLIELEQFRHEAAAAKVKEARLRPRASDIRDEIERWLAELQQKPPPPTA
jgi:hypothetical protein